jgi:hypothetical protein
MNVDYAMMVRQLMQMGPQQVADNPLARRNAVNPLPEGGGAGGYTPQVQSARTRVENEARTFVDDAIRRYGVEGAIGRTNIMRHGYPHQPQWLSRAQEMLQEALTKK